MRALDPVTDHALYSDEQEARAAKATFTLRLDDVLSMPIEVDGTLFDVGTDINLKRHGENGPIEITSFEISDDLYIRLPNHVDVVKLDSSHYKKNFKTKYARLVNALELAALTKAKVSEAWDEEEQEP